MKEKFIGNIPECIVIHEGCEKIGFHYRIKNGIVYNVCDVRYSLIHVKDKAITDKFGIHNFNSISVLIEDGFNKKNNKDALIKLLRQIKDNDGTDKYFFYCDLLHCLKFYSF